MAERSSQTSGTPVAPRPTRKITANCTGSLLSCATGDRIEMRMMVTEARRSRRESPTGFVTFSPPLLKMRLFVSICYDLRMLARENIPNVCFSTPRWSLDG